MNFRMTTLDDARSSLDHLSVNAGKAFRDGVQRARLEDGQDVAAHLRLKRGVQKQSDATSQTHGALLRHQREVPDRPTTQHQVGDGPDEGVQPVG